MKQQLTYITVPNKAPPLLRAQLVAHAYVQASLGKNVYLSEQGVLLHKSERGLPKI